MTTPPLVYLSADTLRRVGGDLDLSRNEALPECFATVIHQQVEAAAGVGGAASIGGNLEGCTCAWVGGQWAADCRFEQHDYAITRSELWQGYYMETSDFLDTLAEGYQGPRVTLEGNSIVVTWQAAVYEDCLVPDVFRLERRGADYTLRLVDTDCLEPPLGRSVPAGMHVLRR